MSYIKLHPIKQFDFQINRILTYGPDACDINEIKSCVGDIKDLSSWYVTWKGLGDKAEAESQYLHAAYYYRLAEFFLTPSPEKEDMYNKSITDYYKIIDKDKDVFKYNVPYQGTYMKTLLFKNPKPKGNIVVFGGYDSFIEEFYLAIKEIKCFKYNIYLFEGPGQGKSLRNGLFFEPYWEKPLSAILDYFNLTDVTVIGISWGGYLALRSAAFENRINNVIAYDVLYDGFDCMTHPFPLFLRLLFYILFAIKAKTLINFMLNTIKNKVLILNWAIMQGEYITGTNNPYDFYVKLKNHTLHHIMQKITCNVLLLAGEKDHYIPKMHFRKVLKGIHNAKSLQGRLFTVQEGGQEHCQIGNHKIAMDYIMNWLNSGNKNGLKYER